MAVSWAASTNVIGTDPLLVDPENGDYSVVSGTPAEDYGCQIFSLNSRDHYLTKTEITSPAKNTFRRSSIEVGGTITSSEFWSADTVKVTDNVIIENGVTVSIDSGVKLEFQDFYSIDVKGTILAIGDPENPIHFTSLHSEYFMVDHSDIGAWNGIKFNNISTLNTTSKLEYCVFEYSKSFEEKGGALQIFNVSGLEITNCIFRNNVADNGGAVSFEYHSSPRIFGNLFENNYAFVSGSPIYCSYSYPCFANNTIASNYVLNEETFHATAAIHSYISKPQLTNNIIWNNETNYYDPHQLLNCKAYYTTYNDIQFGHDGKGNIDGDPLFTEIGENPFALEPGSPCIDSGTSFLPFNFEFPEFDLAGNIRTYNDSIDMGAYEWQGTGISNNQLPISTAQITNYPNPFNPSTTITFELNNSLHNATSRHAEIAENTELIIYNIKGQKVKTYLINSSTDQLIYSVTWNGTNNINQPVSSGIYFAKLKGAKQILTRKMMLIK